MFGRLAGYRRVSAHRRAAIYAIGAVLITNGHPYQANFVQAQQSTSSNKINQNDENTEKDWDVPQASHIENARVMAASFMSIPGDPPRHLPGNISLCKSVSVYTSRGPRSAMEDEYFISDDRSFFAVYDGHGGANVSKYARKNFYKYFKTDFDSGMGTANAFASAFAKVSNEIMQTREFDLEGSTAVAVLLDEDRLWTANLGDSRAVLCRDGEAIDITEDHKPNSDSEKARVEALGGKVRWHGYLGPDRQPVPGMGAYRINGNLAVSRAFGDRLETPFVSDKPDICCFKRNHETDRFVIIASDGLWDVMNGHEAVRFVQKILAGSVGALGQAEAGGGHVKTRRPSRSLTKWMRTYSGDTSMIRAVLDTRKAKIAKYLVEESLRRGTADNVTVVVVWLR